MIQLCHIDILSVADTRKVNLYVHVTLINNEDTDLRYINRRLIFVQCGNTYISLGGSSK